jgi:ribose-phosphate pyrophosphokinase
MSSKSQSTDSLESLDSHLTEDQLKDVLFFTTDSMPDLAISICSRLGVTLSPMFIDYFSNGECRPVIKVSVHGKRIFLISTRSMLPGKSVNDDIMALLLTMEAMTRAGAEKITLILPNYPYARQDKKDEPRAAISAAHLAVQLKAAGLSNLICVDLHAASIQGFFSNKTPVDNLYAIAPIVEYLRSMVFTKYMGLFTAQSPEAVYVAVSPDEGAFKRTRKYADVLNLPFICLTKTRDYSKKNCVDESKTQIIGDLSLLTKRYAIIFDDMCDTFGTVQAAARKLVEAGALGVIVVVTHGILSGPALERLNNTPEVLELICSDSIPQNNNIKLSSKIRVFSIASLIAEVIRRRITKQSVSESFPHS